MEILITEQVYNMLVAWFTEHDIDPTEYLGVGDDGYYVNYMVLMDLDAYFQEIDGAVYLISLRPSQKGVFIGNL